MKTLHHNEGLKMKKPRLHEITTIPIKQLHSQFDNTENATTKSTTVDEWLDIFPQAAIFTGFDDILFDYVITIVYRKHENISTKSIHQVYPHIRKHATHPSIKVLAQL